MTQRGTFTVTRVESYGFYKHTVIRPDVTVTAEIEGKTSVYPANVAVTAGTLFDVAVLKRAFKAQGLKMITKPTRELSR